MKRALTGFFDSKESKRVQTPFFEELQSNDLRAIDIYKNETVYRLHVAFGTSAGEEFFFGARVVKRLEETENTLYRTMDVSRLPNLQSLYTGVALGPEKIPSGLLYGDQDFFVAIQECRTNVTVKLGRLLINTQGGGKGSCTASIEYIDKENRCIKKLTEYLAGRFSDFNLQSLLSFDFDFYMGATWCGNFPTAGGRMANEWMEMNKPYFIALALNLNIEVEELTRKLQEESELLSAYFNATQQDPKPLMDSDEYALVNLNPDHMSQTEFNRYYQVWEQIDKLSTKNEQIREKLKQGTTRNTVTKRYPDEIQSVINDYDGLMGLLRGVMSYLAVLTTEHFHAATDEEKRGSLNKIHSFLTEIREKLEQFACFSVLKTDFNDIEENITKLPLRPFPEALKARKMWQKILPLLKDDLSETEKLWLCDSSDDTNQNTSSLLSIKN